MYIDRKGIGDASTAGTGFHYAGNRYSRWFSSWKYSKIIQTFHHWCRNSYDGVGTAMVGFSTNLPVICVGAAVVGFGFALRKSGEQLRLQPIWYQRRKHHLQLQSCLQPIMWKLYFCICWGGGGVLTFDRLMGGIDFK